MADTVIANVVTAVLIAGVVLFWSRAVIRDQNRRHAARMTQLAGRAAAAESRLAAEFGLGAGPNADHRESGDPGPEAPRVLTLQIEFADRTPVDPHAVRDAVEGAVRAGLGSTATVRLTAADPA